MYSVSTFDFLAELKENNNRPWFEANRHRYESALSEHTGNVDKLLKIIGRWDEETGRLEAKKCIFRIYRDVRFSKDKSPYKTNLGAWFSPRREGWTRAGYYLHIEPAKSFIAGGVYSPGAGHLHHIRQEIDYNLSEFEALLHSSDFQKWWGGKLHGNKLKKAPKGLDPAHPGIEYLKHKDFTAYRYLEDKELQDKNFSETIEQAFRALIPFNSFLDRVWE